MSDRIQLPAKVVILRSPGEPDQQYLTIEGVAALYQELRRLPDPIKTHTVTVWTSRGKLTPAGYFGGLVPLYTPESVQALVDEDKIRRYRKRAKPATDPDRTA